MTATSSQITVSSWFEMWVAREVGPALTGG